MRPVQPLSDGHVNRVASLGDASLASSSPLASLCGNDGSEPYRRLCTMAQVPLNLRKFLPEANIARNSHLGLSPSLGEQ